MRRLGELRPVSVVSLLIVAALIVALALRQNWPLLVVVVVGTAVWAYVARDSARWFR
jgi:hypothetical protein